MEAVLYTVVAIVLYLVADAMLRRIEVALGKTLEYRTLVFFAILLTLALASFGLIRGLLGG